MFTTATAWTQRLATVQKARSDIRQLAPAYEEMAQSGGPDSISVLHLWYATIVLVSDCIDLGILPPLNKKQRTDCEWYLEVDVPDLAFDALLRHVRRHTRTSFLARPDAEIPRWQELTLRRKAQRHPCELGAFLSSWCRKVDRRLELEEIELLVADDDALDRRTTPRPPLQPVVLKGAVTRAHVLSVLERDKGTVSRAISSGKIRTIGGVGRGSLYDADDVLKLRDEQRFVDRGRAGRQAAERAKKVAQN